MAQATTVSSRESAATAEGSGLIAVLGATGTVGRHFVATAHAIRLARLRLGVRDAAMAGRLGLAGPGDDVVVVDVSAPAELDALADGADLLVNCLGPTYRLRGRMAAAAHRAGIGYVDPSGDDTAFLRIQRSGRASPPRTAMMTGVGAVPGAFGLLVRALVSRAPGRVHSVTGYALNAEPIHAGTAMEFLLTLLDRTRASCTWLGGARQVAPAEAPGCLRLPTINGPLARYPYLTSEMENLAHDLGLAQAAFYQAFEADGTLLPALRDLRAGAGSGTDLRSAAKQFAAVVNAAMKDRPPVHLLAAEARTERGLVSGYLRCMSSYRLTAQVAALACREILALRVPAAVLRADALPPALIAELPALDPQTCLKICDLPLMPAGATTA